MKPQLGVVLLSILLVSSVVHAGARDKARVLMKEGNRLVGQGSYDEALEMFQSAYREYPSRKILLNIGTMFLQVGRKAEAADTYEKYLMDPKAEKRREVKAKLTELDKEIARLSISVSRSGAQLLVDGRVVGISPLKKTVRVDPGRRTVVAGIAGKIIAGASLTVMAGRSELVALKANAATTAKPVEKAPEEKGTGADATTKDTRTETDRPDLVGGDASGNKSRGGESGGGLRIAGLITAGVGLVGVGFGVKFGLNAKAASDDVSKVTEWTPADMARYKQGENAEAHMFIAYGVGAAAIIGGGVMYVLGSGSGSAEGDPSAVSVAPQVFPGGASVIVQGSF